MTEKFWEDNIFSRGELDKLIYSQFINQKVDDGIVLEIGGHNGGWLSVSKFFEKQLGFKAILVEPIKELYEISKQKRPNAIHYNYAVSKTKGKKTILINNNATEVSSLEDSSIDWINRWNLSRPEDVECVHMSDITKEASVQHIDLLIIDVEGHELDVLETFDWDNVDVGVISIELLSILPEYSFFKQKDNQCREALLSKGFVHKATLSGDEFWINPNYKRLNKLYNYYTFDIVIPVGPNDAGIILKQLEYTKQNVIGYRNIYLVSYDDNLHVDGCITIPEKIFPFSLQTVADFHGKQGRNGWYLQQLLKLYAGFVIPDIVDKYLVIDSDTFFIKPTIFYQSGKALYNYSNEYHKPYFTHMSKLSNTFTKVYNSLSGICNHMIFETKYVKEIIDIVELTHHDKFYNVFIKNATEIHGSGASEYEIYFNYMLKHHNDEITIRNLKYLNGAKYTNEIIHTEYDYVSYHWYSR